MGRTKTKVQERVRDRRIEYRSIPAKVEIERQNTKRPTSRFRACVTLSSAGIRQVIDSPGKKTAFACAEGRNPRVALSKSLKLLGRHITTRSGAFKGRK